MILKIFIGALFFSTVTLAGEWDQVKKALHGQKLQKAFELSESVYQSSLKKNDEVLQMQARFRLVQIQIGLHGYEKAVTFILSQPPPKKEVYKALHFLLKAQTLEKYLQAYRSEISQRERNVDSSCNDVKPESLREWSLAQVKDCVLKSYSAGLVSLGKNSIDWPGELKEFLQKNSYPQGVRSSVRDVLVYMAREFLGDTSFWTPEEENQVYQLNISSLVSTGANKYSLTQNQVHPLLRLASLLNEHEEWHLQNKRDDAALEARYQLFASVFAVLRENSDREKLIQSLKKYQQSKKPQGWWARGQSLLAEFWRDQNSESSLIEARAEAQLGVQADAKGQAGEYCKKLISEIEAPSYNLLGMKVDRARAKSIQVTYKNIKKLYFRAYAVNVDDWIQQFHKHSAITPEQVKSFLNTQKPQREWSETLWEMVDYREHTQWVSPNLENNGLYLILASQNSDFSENKNVIQGIRYAQSDVILDISNRSGKLHVRALSGLLGENLSHVSVSLYKYSWDQAPSLVKTDETNANGEIQFNSPSTLFSRQSSYFLVARYKKGTTESVLLESEGVHFYEPQTSKKSSGALIFLDRPIYRPEQKLQWKINAFDGSQSQGDFKSAKSGTTLKVVVRDPNYEVVSRQEVKVNKFGSASGEFILPKNRPLGEWQILVEDKYGAYSVFKVEEYKRPTFEAELTQPRTELKLNQKIKIQGKAKYYFGSALSKGRVVWRVSREIVQPWDFFWRWDYFLPMPTQPEMITSGSSSLNSQGEFEVDFLAKADVREKDRGYSYNYIVEADVTDEGGETRSTKKSFRLGFVGVEAQLKASSEYFQVGQKIFWTSQRTWLDGTPAPGSALIRVFKLKNPATTQMPSEKSQPRPATRYQVEGDLKIPRWQSDMTWQKEVASWEIEKPVIELNLNHDSSGQAAVNLPPVSVGGAYKIVYETKDKSGAIFKTETPFIVASAETNLALPLVSLFEKSQYEVGEKARLFVASGFVPQTIYIEQFRGGQWISGRYLELQKSNSIDFDITPADRGGLSFRVTMVHDYQKIQQEHHLSVPWSDKKLEFEFIGLRDRMEPSTKEKFQIAVSSESLKQTKSSLQQIEVLAYMFDRSLEFFKAHTPPSMATFYPSRQGVAAVTSSLGLSYGQLFLGQSPNFAASPVWEMDRFNFLDSYGVGGPGYFGGALYKSVQRRNKMEISSMTMLAESSPQAMVKKEAAIIQDKKEAVSNSKNPSLGSENDSTIRFRSDFSETVFFKPHLTFDGSGRTLVEFQLPDSVTSWKIAAHGFSQGMAFGDLQKEVITAKELMVRPYLPRFLREGDKAQIQVMVTNNSNRDVNGQVELVIESTKDNSNAMKLFGFSQAMATQSIKVLKQASTTVTFSLQAPRGVEMYRVKTLVRSGNGGDAEINPLPILASRAHLVQSRFATIKNQQTKILEFKDLAQNNDDTRENEKMVITVDAQLFAGVLKALPSLIDSPYECIELLVNRYVSTSIVNSIYNQYPEVEKLAQSMLPRKTALEAFNEKDANRRLLFEETPWLRESMGEDSGALKTLSILDRKNLKIEKEKALDKIKKMQNKDGGFSWFAGGPSEPFMTAYVLLSLTRLFDFGEAPPKDLVVRAWKYARAVVKDQWLAEMKQLETHIEVITLINYALSRYPDVSWQAQSFSEKEQKKLLDFSFRNWKKHSPRIKAYLAMTLLRHQRMADGRLVWDSVMDSAKSDPELGTYWAPEERSWLWYNDAIETQALGLRTLAEVNPDDQKLEGLVQWIFLNKKLNQWKSTRATAEVIYSLASYLNKKNQLSAKEEVMVDAGTVKAQFVFSPEKYTGAKNQIVIDGKNIEPTKNSKISFSKNGEGMAFVSSTWHFSTDQLVKSESGDFFKISRQYFKRVAKGTQWELVPLKEKESVQVGDQIEVHLSLRSQHQAEYVHLKDPRPSGFEPDHPVSEYKYDGRINWYEEVRDSGTHFFLSAIPVGEYTFKYRLRANMAGSFRVGPAEIQSVYAPEFNAYSQGHEIQIK